MYCFTSSATALNAKCGRVDFDDLRSGKWGDDVEFESLGGTAAAVAES